MCQNIFKNHYVKIHAKKKKNIIKIQNIKFISKLSINKSILEDFFFLLNFMFRFYFNIYNNVFS